MLRVATWNCNMAFRKKSKFIEAYKPDILIVPECEHPDKLIFDAPSQIPNAVFWYGKNLHKGIGVFSYTDYKISLLPYHEDCYKMILPLCVTNGTTTYTVFAIWANNPEDRGFQYVGQTWKAIKQYQDQLGQKQTLLVGDFNSNSIWDRPKRLHNHTTVVDVLAQQGIESTYHHYFKEAQGKETQPTHFLYRHADKPYHLDYCFASADMMPQLKKVVVGQYADWTHASDHVPLIIDFK